MERGLFAEMRSYVGFTDADAAILTRLHGIASQCFDAVADEFHALIRAHEGAFAVLRVVCVWAQIRYERLM